MPQSGHAISRLSCLTKFLFRFGLLKFRWHYTLFDDFEYKQSKLFLRSRYRLRHHSDIAYCFPFFGPFNITAFETIRRFNCRCLDRLGLSEMTATLQNVLFSPFLPSYLLFLYYCFCTRTWRWTFSYHAVVLTDNIMGNQNRRIVPQETLKSRWNNISF